MVDPTVELTQPGGPFDYGDAILADGAGGYTIAPTLRPYFIGFGIPSQVQSGGSVSCHHHGVDSRTAGFVVPPTTSLIAISVSLDRPVGEGHSYRVEVFTRSDAGVEPLASLVIQSGRRAWRRDLSVSLSEGAELGAVILQQEGTNNSEFTSGIVGVELEG